MARLIDAVKAAEAVSSAFNISMDDLVDVFAKIPTVRPSCNTCKHLDTSTFMCLNDSSKYCEEIRGRDNICVCWEERK